MSSGSNGFEELLHPAEVQEIKAWSSNPELSKLLSRLQSMKDREQILDHCAEVRIAIYLKKRGWTLEYEVPTVDDRTADFRATNGDNIFIVHVKRTNLDGQTTKNMNISRRLSVLKEICRPVVVSLIFFKSLNNEEMQFCVKEGRTFIQKANEEDTKEIKMNGDGEVLGKFEMGPCHKGQNVRLNLIFPAIDGNSALQIENQLSKAYHQFMPKNHDNIIVMTSFWPDEGSIEDLRDALDDFWRDGKHSLSNVIVHFTEKPGDGTIALKPFFRNDKIPACIAEMFPEAG